MVIVLTIVHVLVCLVLILVVLLQSGKAADLAGAFGGMGSQTAFGPRGAATMLTKATTVCAVVFMVTSLTLAVMATRRAGPSSVLEKSGKTAPAAPAKTPAQAPATTPATPATPPAKAPAKAPVEIPLGTIRIDPSKQQQNISIQPEMQQQQKPAPPPAQKK